jgi:Tfp pilus assembly protein PilV
MGSLVGVMVAAAIMSIIMLGTARQMEYSLLVNQTAMTQNNLTSLVSSTANMTQNATTCTQAVTAIPETYGTNFHFGTLASGVSLPQYGLTVNYLTYVNPTLVDTGSDGTKAFW